LPEDYRSRIGAFESVFGREAIAVRLFDRSSLYKESLVHDFCDAAGIEWQDDFVVPPDANTSVSFSVLRILNRLNELVPTRLYDGSANPQRGSLSHTLGSVDTNPVPYLPTQSEVDAYEAFFEASNGWLREQYFPERDDLWEAPVRVRKDDVGFESALTESDELLLRYVLHTWSDYWSMQRLRGSRIHNVLNGIARFRRNGAL
jgi:hypothetical protein